MRTTNPIPTTPADPAQAAAAGSRAVRAEHPRSARRALVVGMGVSGMAAATRLHRAGWSVTIVERSRQRRTGGYFVALFGTGQKAARRLGLLDALHDRAGDAASLDIDRSGRAHPAMTLADAPGKPWMMLRGDVERATFEALPDEVEIRFATSPVGISQDADGADVTLEERSGSRTTERFDLVIGADGIHSTVRRLVFGPDERFIKPLGYMVAAFIYPGAAPRGLEPGQMATVLEPERGVTVFGCKDHDPSVLFSYRTDHPAGERDGDPADRLRSAFGPEPLGDLLEDLIDQYAKADDRLFDAAEQVTMDSWHRGRVVLLGDSAWCVTLFAGMGVTSGLAGSDVLGTALERHPDDLDAALELYEATMRPFIESYQESAFTQRHVFVPSTRREIRARRLLMRVNAVPGVGALSRRLMPLTEVADHDSDIVGSLEDTVLTA
jgi:2-polyprenyl-6-methoxyphenol hydroxylase-like FAD-dependent oxidoreductase